MVDGLMRNFVPLLKPQGSAGVRIDIKPGPIAAADVQADVLIIDEVLSVGDEAFQRKSTGRMLEFRDNGATILFVSHNMASIELMCHRVVWIDHGHVRADGDVRHVIDAYRQSQGG